MGAPWTPGPWQMVWSTSGHFMIGIADRDGVGVTDPRFNLWRGDDAEAKANARLIASAPDLAEALEPFAAIDFFPDAPSSAEVIKVRVAIEGTAYEASVTIGDFRRARAALSKAKGETA
ncbi:MAG: hypothetical protein IPK85_01900 [Gemmatimonadetes bacterium]|nr:hypothetical protein [Gemmatimonadota bacterium]